MGNIQGNVAIDGITRNAHSSLFLFEMVQPETLTVEGSITVWLVFSLTELY